MTQIHKWLEEDKSHGLVIAAMTAAVSDDPEMKQERERLQKEEQITDDEEIALRPYLTYMPLDKTWAEQLVITAMSA